jgi:hypothetical protein
VINVWLERRDFASRLQFPGDGHPTGVANLARAKILQSALGELAVLPAPINAVSGGTTFGTD